MDKKPYDCLVLNAPTADITNLDTSNHTQNHDTSILQQKVLSSCENIFRVASSAIENNSDLKKVVIMEHTPRYDTKELDPVGIKPVLANYANNVLNQFVLDSNLKHKISMGRHSLEVSDASHDDIFKNVEDGKYDGVHHYGRLGRKLISRSLMNILRKNVNTWDKPDQPHSYQPYIYHKEHCPQALYQKRQKYEATVKVSNRFSVFNSNQGNL